MQTNESTLEFIVKASGLFECNELLCDFFKSYHLALRFCSHVVPVAHVDGLSVEFFLAHNCIIGITYISVHDIFVSSIIRTENEVVLRDLAIADLLVQRL